MTKAKSTFKPQMSKEAALRAILTKRGRLTPASVVEEAKNPKHPLHSLFCWDDTEAARRYREHQAAEMIRHCRVEITPHKQSQTITVRSFVSVRDAQDDEGGACSKGHYVTVQEALGNEDYKQQIINQALKDFMAFESKYHAFAFLADTVENVRQLAKKISGN